MGLKIRSGSNLLQLVANRSIPRRKLNCVINLLIKNHQGHLGSLAIRLKKVASEEQFQIPRWRLGDRGTHAATSVEDENQAMGPRIAHKRKDLYRLSMDLCFKLCRRNVL